MGSMVMPYMGYDITDNIKAIQIIREGMDIRAFEGLRKDLGITDAQLARITGIPVRTLFKRKAQGRLKPLESERLARIARVFSRSIDVFEDRDRARTWMLSPVKSLGGQSALEMCGTEPGAIEVERVLGRIEHGIVS